MKGFFYLSELVVGLNLTSLIEFLTFSIFFSEKFSKNQNNIIYAELEKVQRYWKTLNE
jgi:hypothetical protein